MQLHEHQALMREAASWNGLEHANIVCLLGTCIIENRFHLVMDKCDMSLDDLLYESETDAATLALSLDEKEAVLRGIARGLEYLHGNLIVHRHLKPANILLSRDLGLVKPADFGLATQVEANSSIADTISSVGTPAYMAPEVLQAPIRWTTRADIYAFGIVMWEVYHGKSPFEHSVRSISDLETRVLSGERPMISDEVDVRLWVVRLMEKCWEHNPQDRPRASEILRTFEGRTNVRRSTRLIRGLVSVFSRSRGGSNGIEDASIELVQGLVRDLSEDTGNLMRTLDTLRISLEQERDADAGDALRAEARSRGIIVSMKRILEHNTDPGILARALWVLRFALTGSSGTSFRAAAIQEHDFGSIAIELFQAFRDHEDLQAAACGFFIPVTHDSDRNREILGQELKVGKEIVAAMRAHPRSEVVQEKACGALGNLAFGNDRNRVILGQELKVGKEIVAAMRAHLANERVQISACAALWTLAANDRNKVILGQELKVGKEIVAAMRAHPRSEAVQENACGALGNLAFGNDRNKVILGQELKVGKEIVAATRAHPRSEVVQEKACGALGNLAFGNDRNRVILGQELKVGKEIVAAMRAHLANESVQIKACATLWNLSVNDRNCVILGQELKVGKEIVAAMRAHPRSEAVQEKACGALRNLAFNSSVKAILRRQGAVEAVQRTCERFPTLSAAKDAKAKLRNGFF